MSLPWPRAATAVAFMLAAELTVTDVLLGSSPRPPVPEPVSFRLWLAAPPDQEGVFRVAGYVRARLADLNEVRLTVSPSPGVQLLEQRSTYALPVPTIARGVSHAIAIVARRSPSATEPQGLNVTLTFRYPTTRVSRLLQARRLPPPGRAGGADYARLPARVIEGLVEDLERLEAGEPIVTLFRGVLVGVGATAPTSAPLSPFVAP